MARLVCVGKKRFYIRHRSERPNCVKCTTRPSRCDISVLPLPPSTPHNAIVRPLLPAGIHIIVFHFRHSARSLCFAFVPGDIGANKQRREDTARRLFAVR